MTTPDPRRVTTFRRGWLHDQVAKSVASLDSLPPKLRASLAQPSRTRRPAREFPADPPTRPPVMAEGATWPSGAVAPFPAAWFNALAAAIVGAIPPDDACIADEAECFERHPIHLGWSVDGTARTVYAKVDGLIEIVLAAVVPLIRAQVAAEHRCVTVIEEGPPEFFIDDHDMAAIGMYETGEESTTETDGGRADG